MKIDKYDILIIRDFIRKYINDRKYMHKRYQFFKKDWLVRYYYTLRAKRSASYHKKNGGDLPMHKAIERAFVLDTRQTYAWEILTPIKEK